MVDMGVKTAVAYNHPSVYLSRDRKKLTRLADHGSADKPYDGLCSLGGDHEDRPPRERHGVETCVAVARVRRRR
jgi:hypothetical protein